MTTDTCAPAVPQRHRLREHLPFAAAMAFLSFCALRHSGFMVLLAAPFIAAWLVYSAVVALRWPARRRAQAIKGAILALVLAVVAIAHWSYARDARSHAQALADAVLAFQAREGRLPERAADVGVDEAQARRQWRLHYQLESGTPQLFYATTFTPFEIYYFDFGTREWVYRPD